MKLITCIAVVLLSALVSIEAFPQKATFQRLPYYPPPTNAPHMMRARRAALDGMLTSNPAGGADANLVLAQGIGTPDHNVIATAFARGNTDKGPVTSGGKLDYNLNGLGLSVAQEHIPGIRDTFKESAHVDLLKNNENILRANVFKSQNTLLANGLKFDRKGGGLEWEHKNGHGAAATLSSIPNFGKQLELAGKANLWSSPDKNTRLDLSSTASKWMSGPLSSQSTSFGGMLGLTHFFSG